MDCLRHFARWCVLRCCAEQQCDMRVCESSNHHHVPQPHQSAVCAGQGKAAFAACQPWEPQPYSMVGGVAAAVQQLHDVTGLPWWATLAAWALLCRATLSPLAYQQARAASAAATLVHRARSIVHARHAATTMQHSTVPVTAAANITQPAAMSMTATRQSQHVHDATARAPHNASTKPQTATSTASFAEVVRHTGAQSHNAAHHDHVPPPSQAAESTVAQHDSDKQSSEDGASSSSHGSSASRRASTREVVHEYMQLQRAAAAPHPLWIVAAPLVQVPVFVVNMMAVRHMCLLPWPGFANGGTLWFKDLSVHAVDWTRLFTAQPMGMYGAVLPGVVTVLYLANVNRAFQSNNAANMVDNRDDAAVVRWVMGMVRLGLEWLSLPILLSALQLPQGVLVYWASSMSYTFIQHAVLSMPAVRSMLGVQLQQQKQAKVAATAALAQQDLSQLPHDNIAAAQQTDDKCVNDAAQRVSVQQFIASTSDTDQLIALARTLRAGGQLHAAMDALRKVMAQRSSDTQALMLMGQVQLQMQQPDDAVSCFERVRALCGPKSKPHARALFGTAVARNMQGRSDEALRLLKRAVLLLPDDAQVWLTLASLHARCGNTAASEQALQHAARLDPSGSIAKRYLNRD